MRFNYFPVSQVKNWLELLRWDAIMFGSLNDLLTNGLSFQDNMDCQIIESSLNSGENSIQHTLNRVPVGYVIIKKNNNVSIWDGFTTNTTQFLYLNSSGTSTVKVLIF